VRHRGLGVDLAADDVVVERVPADDEIRDGVDQGDRDARLARVDDRGLAMPVRPSSVRSSTSTAHCAPVPW
jgi:hypothetical protein